MAWSTTTWELYMVCERNTAARTQMRNLGEALYIVGAYLAGVSR